MLVGIGYDGGNGDGGTVMETGSCCSCTRAILGRWLQVEIW